MPRLLTLISVLAAGTIVAVAGPARPAAAGPGGEGAAFVWSDLLSPGSDPHTPSPTYQFNSTSPQAAVNTVRHLPGPAGHYEVRFPGLGLSGPAGFGVAHVTAYGGDSTACSVTAITRHVELNDTAIEVSCFSPSGQDADSLFTASLTTVRTSGGGRPMAYMIATPSGLVGDFNSTGAWNSVTREATGSYVVRLPNLGAFGGHAQVTAMGARTRCKVVGWGPEGATQVVRVLCSGVDGNRRDSSFMFTYVEGLDVLGRPPGGHDSAYAWADQPSAGLYRPRPSYQFDNGGNLAATAGRFGPGDYVMRFADADLSRGNVQVTAYGWGNEYCGVVGWLVGDGIRVRCFDAAGAPVDAFYDVAFTGPPR